MASCFCAEAKVVPQKAEEMVSRMRSANPELVIQLVSMEDLPKAKTVRMIAAQTARAMGTGALLASKPEVDLLLRLAGTGQIAVAMKTCGYDAPGRKMLVALGPDGPLESLRETVAKQGAFKELKGDEIDEKGLRMVETAALLAARA